MEGIIDYEIGTGRAFDENGDDLELRFCMAFENDKPQQNYVRLNGVLHQCLDFQLFLNLLSFRVQPVDLRLVEKLNVIEMEVVDKFRDYETEVVANG